MRFFSLALCALITCDLTTTISARAQETTAPSTQSTTAATTQPDAIDLSTPKAAMLSYDRQSGGGPEVFIPFYQIKGNEDEELVLAITHTDSMLGLLQVMVEKKWGNAGVNTVLHAFGSKTRDDMIAATVTVTGDRAKLAWADGGPPVAMVRVDGEWKIDATAYRKSLGVPVGDYAASLRALSPVISDVADAIDAGKLTMPEAAAAEATRRIKELGQ
jgi:hypothetical protein